MTASNPAHEMPDDRNVYDATRQAMHAAVTDEKLDAITAKIDDLSRQIGARFEQVDKRFEQVDKRFEQVEGRLAQLDDRFFGLQQVLIAGAVVIVAAMLGTQL